jgi:AcrR family transcriptional regulator
MDAVLDAAADLFAEHGPRDTTIRDVAARAGVNHALVHRYFGTKEELLRAVLERHAHTLAVLASSAGDTATAVHLLFREITRRSAYIDSLTRAAMDGMHPERFIGSFPVIRGMIASVTESQPSADPRLTVAAMSALALGWHIFDDFLVEAAQLQDLPRDEVNARIEELLLGMLTILTTRDAPPDVKRAAGGIVGAP